MYGALLACLGLQMLSVATKDNIFDFPKDEKEAVLLINSGNISNNSVVMEYYPESFAKKYFENIDKYLFKITKVRGINPSFLGTRSYNDTYLSLICFPEINEEILQDYDLFHSYIIELIDIIEKKHISRVYVSLDSLSRNISNKLELYKILYKELDNRFVLLIDTEI